MSFWSVFCVLFWLFCCILRCAQPCFDVSNEATLREASEIPHLKSGCGIAAPFRRISRYVTCDCRLKRRRHPGICVGWTTFFFYKSVCVTGIREQNSPLEPMCNPPFPAWNLQEERLASGNMPRTVNAGNVMNVVTMPNYTASTLVCKGLPG